MQAILFVFAAALAGSFIQTVSGFGYAIIVMSILPMLVPFQTAAIIELITAAFMSLAIAFNYRRHIRWKLVFWPLLSNVVAAQLGVMIQTESSEQTLRRILGAVLILLAVYFIFFSKKFHLPGTPEVGLAAGFVGGLCGGMMSIGGPPMVVYYLAATDSKEEYNATMQTFFVLTCLNVFITHLVMGHMTGAVLRFGVWALAGVGLGTLLGLKLFDRLSGPALKKLVYAFMSCTGLYLLIFG